LTRCSGAWSLQGGKAGRKHDLSSVRCLRWQHRVQAITQCLEQCRRISARQGKRVLLLAPCTLQLTLILYELCNERGMV
jgi:hypothetical protein